MYAVKGDQLDTVIELVDTDVLDYTTTTKVVCSTNFVSIAKSPVRISERFN